MSIHIETAGRLRASLRKGAAWALVAAALTASPLAAQTAAPLFEDPAETLLEAPDHQHAEPAAAPSVPFESVPFEPNPDRRFENRPAAPAAAASLAAGAAREEAPAPLAGLGFSPEPTRLDAQSLNQVGARGDEIVQSVARDWGLSSSTLYMLGALLGLLGLLLLARLFGLGQRPPRRDPRSAKAKPTPARRAVARIREPQDDWEEEPEAEDPSPRRAAARRSEARAEAEPKAAPRPLRRVASAQEGWDEDWAEEAPEAAPTRAETAAARAPRRPNLGRLAASIRETWPKEHEDALEEEPPAAHPSPARAAAARVAREFAEAAPDEIPPQPRRSRTAPRGGDFLDALEAAGDHAESQSGAERQGDRRGEGSGLDRIRALTRVR